MLFKLEVKETFRKVVEIEAENATAAILKAYKSICDDPKNYTVDDRSDLSISEYKEGE